MRTKVRKQKPFSCSQSVHPRGLNILKYRLVNDSRRDVQPPLSPPSSIEKEVESL